MSVLATVAGERFKGNLTAKIDFLNVYFIVPMLMLTLEVYSLFHTLFDKVFGPHAGENLNKIVWSELYKILSFLTKNG